MNTKPPITRFLKDTAVSTISLSRSLPEPNRGSTSRVGRTLIFVKTSVAKKCVLFFIRCLVWSFLETTMEKLEGSQQAIGRKPALPKQTKLFWTTEDPWVARLERQKKVVLFHIKRSLYIIHRISMLFSWCFHGIDCFLCCKLAQIDPKMSPNCTKRLQNLVTRELSWYKQHECYKVNFPWSFWKISRFSTFQNQEMGVSLNGGKTPKWMVYNGKSN